MIRSAVPPAVEAATKFGDLELARVIEAWPDLAEPIRRALLAMIEAATIDD
jgi:hypothetical protein